MEPETGFCGVPQKAAGKELLIFDEPTSGLDGKNMLLIAEQLKNAVKNGKTVLVITHDEEFISKCCDYRLCVDEMKSMKK